jgi:RNA polymerase sigma-70 factor, ECF subfamily
VTDPIVPENRSGSPSTSISLLQAALAKDRDAWERIVFLYSPLVERWCRRRHLNSDEVQDIGQDVFLTLYKNLDKFRKDDPGHSFRKWLWTITDHKVLDYFRAKSVQPVAGLIYEGHLPDVLEAESESAEAEAHSDLLVLLRRCLEVVRAEFEPRTFEAFWLVLEGKRPTEVSTLLTMPVGAVYTARSRVTRRLRDVVSELEDNLPEI